MIGGIKGRSDLSTHALVQLLHSRNGVAFLAQYPFTG